MNDLVVYTAITGNCVDKLHPVEPAEDIKGRRVKFVCFTHAATPVRGWEIRPPVWEHNDNARRTARWHKIMSHFLFPEAEWTIWHDGSHNFKIDPCQLIDEVSLWAGTFATFKHPLRDCMYQELQACLKLKKDNARIMQAQVAGYRAAGMPEHFGLFETACVVRHNREEVKKINEAWWQEIASGSLRDQLSLPYVLWRNPDSVVVSRISGCRDRSQWFDVYPHWCVRRAV